MQLESLQLAANVAADATNARGSLIDARLQDILARVQEIALHGVRHGASVALTAAQVQTGHDLHAMEAFTAFGTALEAKSMTAVATGKKESARVRMNPIKLRPKRQIDGTYGCGRSRRSSKWRRRRVSRSGEEVLQRRLLENKSRGWEREKGRRGAL